MTNKTKNNIEEGSPGYFDKMTTDSQKFVAKHVVDKDKNQKDKKVGTSDDVFNATNVKAVNRKATKHGYDGGDDEKVYEEMAHSKTCMCKACMAKARSAKNEEVEQMEEAKNKSHSGYGYAADAHFAKQSPKMQSAINMHLKKGKSYDDAVKAAKVHVKEETELDEARVRYSSFAPERHEDFKAMNRDDRIKHLHSLVKLSQSHPDEKLRGNAKRAADEFRKKYLGSKYLKSVKEEAELDEEHPSNLRIQASMAAKKYGANHPKAIAAAKRAKEAAMKEEVEQIDERNKQNKFKKDLYVAKKGVEHATKNLGFSPEHHADMSRAFGHDKPTERDNMKALLKDYKRRGRAVTKEEVEQIDEKLSDEQKKGVRTALGPRTPNNPLRKGTGSARALISLVKKSGVKEELELDEKHLTPAEVKKREEIAKAIERENPGMDKSKKMAIATAQAKKVAEDANPMDAYINAIKKVDPSRPFVEERDIGGDAEAKAFKTQYLDKYPKASNFDKQFAAAAIQGKDVANIGGKDIAIKFKGPEPSYVSAAKRDIAASVPKPATSPAPTAASSSVEKKGADLVIGAKSNQYVNRPIGGSVSGIPAQTKAQSAAALTGAVAGEKAPVTQFGPRANKAPSNTQLAQPEQKKTTNFFKLNTIQDTDAMLSKTPQGNLSQRIQGSLSKAKEAGSAAKRLGKSDTDVPKVLYKKTNEETKPKLTTEEIVKLVKVRKEKKLSDEATTQKGTK